MRLYSYLYKNRFGIYYLRIQKNGVDRRISLRTRDPELARHYSYQFGASISPMKMNKEISVWGLKISNDGFEATDIKTKEEAEQVEVLVSKFLAHRQILASAKSNVIEEEYFSPPILLKDAIYEYLLQTKVISDSKEDPKDRVPEKSFNMMKSTLYDLKSRVGDIYVHQLTDELVLNKWREPRRTEVADTTVKRDLSFIRAFSNWCAEKGRGYIPKPLEISLTVKKKNRNHYDHFLKAEMEVMINHLFKLQEPWHFWCMLIGIYTGARIGEIAGIKLDYFETISGIETVFIPGTKTGPSERRIPLHPDLLEIGLLDYVARRKERKAEMIFPVKWSKHNGWGASGTKWFSYLKINKFKFSENKVFHSFRPTIVDVMKQAKVNEELRCQYVGHEYGSSVHIDTYSRNKFRLATVQEVLEHIDYSKYYEDFYIDVPALKNKAKKLLKKV